MKRIIIILLLIAVGAGAYYYLNKDKYVSVDMDEIEIAVKNTEDITRITLSNRDKTTIDLVKTDDNWVINDSYPVFEPVINRFMNKTLSKLKVKGKVPEKVKNSVIRSMTGSAIKVKVYVKGKLQRNFYLGGPTADQTGTHFWVEGAESPFIAHIPGFDGYITPQFSMIENEWISRTIFDYETDEISSIKLTNYEDESASFKLLRNGDTYSFENSSQAINQQAAKSYFALYKFKNFEGFAEYISPEVKKAILEQKPYLKIEVQPVKGKMKDILVFRKGSETSRTLYDKKGDVIAYDVERYFAKYNLLEEIVTIQEYTFGKLFVNGKSFYTN